MSAQIAIPAAPKDEAIAERLLAHARLCEQIAHECLNEETAYQLRRMAQDCAQAAAQLAPRGASDFPHPPLRRPAEFQQLPDFVRELSPLFG